MKAMLAGSLRDPADLPEGAFPLSVTPKVDGVRALLVGGKLVSRSLKLIPNAAARRALERALPEGADGELSVGVSFNDTASAVMSRDGSVDGMRFVWFDLVSEGKGYLQRVAEMSSYVSENQSKLEECPVEIVPLVPETAGSPADVSALEERYLSEGYEGLIIRRPDGLYKRGRSTQRELLMLKLKRFSDAEARIVGCKELQRGSNGAGTLGALEAEDLRTGKRFKIGTGFDAALRGSIWEDRGSLEGRIVKYKSMPVAGTDAKPRHPVFLGFRSSDDM
jgi:DNA ligase 1